VRESEGGKKIVMLASDVLSGLSLTGLISGLFRR
jgi:hypothetical protein